MSKLSIEEVKSIINNMITRSRSKEKILERLNGMTIEQKKINNTNTESNQTKLALRQAWIEENIKINNNIRQSLNAFFSLDEEVIRKHYIYISKQLLQLYDSIFGNVDSSTATNIRKAICRLDEVMNRSKVCINK